MNTTHGTDSRCGKPEDIVEIACSQCGHGVELFKADGARRCQHCGNRVVYPKISIGCGLWCKQAAECPGDDPAAHLEENGETSLVDQLIQAMKIEFGDDQPRITHALKVLQYARQIIAVEAADPRVVFAAAVLHDIGIQQAERRHGSAAGKYQEIEGPPIAQRIMAEIGLDAETIVHVSRIVGSHHSAHDIDTAEFRIIWDADWLVNIPDMYAGSDSHRLQQVVAKVFRTGEGKKIATRLFLTEDSADTTADARE